MPALKSSSAWKSSQPSPLPCTVLCSVGSAQHCHSCELKLEDWHAGTGGIVDLKHWRNIDWTPIHALAGGSDKFQTGLGLKPWYVKGHANSQGPGKTSYYTQIPTNRREVR